MAEVHEERRRAPVPQSFQTRLTFAFTGVVALTLVLVAPVVVWRLDDFFRQQEEQRLQARATATEFEILRHLASRPGRVFTRRELLELLRDYEALDQDEKTINVHVSHLRDKIEDDPSAPQFVLTVRGAGYQFAER